MTLLLAGALAGLVLVAILVTILLVRRSSRRADSRVAELIETLNARIDELARELARARESAEEELRRSRLLADFGATIDLDEVLARTLRAASEATGSHAALVWLSSASGPPMVATLGLSQEEAERQAVAGPPDGRRARAIGMSYRYAPEEAALDGDLIRSGLAVPMPGYGDGGYLVVFSREELDVGDAVVGDLEQLAERAGPAIENARRFQEARQLADLDALTGLHNRRFFHETLAREVARAHRYGRDLALILFDLDNFKAINDRIGHLAGDAVLADAAARVREVVRSADIACRVGGDEFAVVLPEATVGDADRLYQRLQKVVSVRPIGDAGQIVFSAGVAGLAHDDDPVSFFQKADTALYRAKEAGKGRLVGVADAAS
jgi:diguanylate cyclase (GGDEF)-like protein